jgi:hypothetical protein
MSSSNLVRLSYIKEATYGETPVTGDLTQIRYTSESLSGEPVQVESEESRTDRASGGQIVAGLEIAGDLSGELSHGVAYSEMMLSVMKWPSWEVAVPSTASQLDILDDGSGLAGSITDTGAANDFTTLYSVGDAIQLTGGWDAVIENENKTVLITALTATVITYAGKLIDETGSGDEIITRGAYVEVGGDQNTTDHSYTFEKNFLDLTDKSFTYTGVMPNTMEVGLTWGELATITFGFMGKDWDHPATPISDGRTVTPPESDTPLNASIDAGSVLIDGAVSPYCVRSLTISLDNAYRTETCLGNLAANKLTPGTAAISVSMEAYLADENVDLHKKRIENTPIEVFSSTRNDSGGYAFHLKKVYLSFSDSSSEGRDTDTMLNMEGLAAAPSTGNQFRLYQLS